MLAHLFGPPDDWPSADLIAFSDEFDAGLALAGYRSGVFPMPLHVRGFDQQMGWWSPVHRGVLPLSGVRVSHSLRQSAKKYRTSVDTAFDEVIRRCGDPRRPGGWIDDAIIDAYTDMYRSGLVHSVETWDAEGRLVGGLYGVSLNGLFAGESMFHDAALGRDASKVALLRLVEILSDGHDRLLDVQWRTDHLGSLGAIEIPRDTYLARLDAVLDQPPVEWPPPEPTAPKARHA